MQWLRDTFTRKTWYWQSSRALGFGLLSILPLLTGYELLALWANHGQTIQVRNGADVVLREMLDWVGIHSPFYIGLILVLAIVWALRKRQSRAQIRLSFFFMSIVESMIYALVMAYGLTPLTRMLLSAGDTPPNLHAQLMLSLGAGVYEELVFRAFLFAGSAYALEKILKWDRSITLLISVVVSSILFSMAHYMGRESYSFYSALFRFLAGVVLCIIYRLRGLGIAAWSHALYDVMVVLY